MDKSQKLVQIIKETAKEVPMQVRNNNEIFSKIPFNVFAESGLISQEEYNKIKPYIDEFKLNDPKNMIKWLIDIHFAGIESINDSVSAVRRDLLSSEIGTISAVKDKIATDNDKNFNKNLEKPEFKAISTLENSKYEFELMKVIGTLEDRIKNYIKEINDIDNLHPFIFFLQANFNKKKVDTDVQLTKASLKAYFEALNIYMVIANQNYRRQSNIKVNQYLEKKRDFIKGLSFSLLLAYDKEKDESFWNSSVKLKEIDKIKSISKNLSEYLLCEEEKEIDFENNVIY